MASAQTRLLLLRRFLDLCRHRRFASSLFARDPRIDRGIDILRVRDAIHQGASQREIGAMLFGVGRVARAVAHGGYCSAGADGSALSAKVDHGGFCGPISFGTREKLPLPFWQSLRQSCHSIALARSATFVRSRLSANAQPASQNCR